MTVHKTKFLVNPNADMGRAWRTIADLRPLVEKFGGADWAGTVYPTHATILARQAAEAGYTLVIATGGDGTVHEVINGLMQVPPEARPRLGIVPLGSGNDFAHSVGIHGNPAEALKQIYTGQPKRIDLGVFDIGWGEHEYFNNTFGMGFDATVTIRTHRLTHIRGFMMYLVAVLQTIALNHEAPRMHIVTDGETWDDETIMLVVCNGPREGGGFLVAPGADITDGILNYASICHVSRLMMLRMIPEVMKGTHGRFKQVRLGQLHKLQLHSERPMTIHADGEVISGFGTDVRNVTVEVVPGALEIIT
ncbi:MAG: diacylglycerol kinase family protein [Anaerolineales bacterium]